MAKKAHKKLRDLQRLQSLYGSNSIPTTESVRMVEDSSAKVDTKSSAAVVHHSNVAGHALVAKDLKSLLLIMALMTALLIGVYWLVGHTALSESIIGIGRSFSSK